MGFAEARPIDVETSSLVVVVMVVVAVRVGEQEGIADGKQEGEGSTDGPPGHGQVVSLKVIRPDLLV